MHGYISGLSASAERGCAMAGLASTALVLSIAAPFGGNNWYALTLLSPLSGLYYWQRGTRQEEVQVRYASVCNAHHNEV